MIRHLYTCGLGFAILECRFFYKDLMANYILMETRDSLELNQEGLEKRVDGAVAGIIQQFRQYPSVVPQNGVITLTKSSSERLRLFKERLVPALRQNGYYMPVYISDQSGKYTIEVDSYLKLNGFV